jgi:2-polyprenyl-6-methoxyphenol hydroxylase-like FAD-dependent oxidoreductase
MRKRRALIIGGSVGGLFAAHLFRAIDWDVMVFERNAEDLASRGAGIGTHDALFEVMKRIGLPFDVTAGIATHSYAGINRDGEIILEVAQSRIMSVWSQLYTMLRNSLPAEIYCLGKMLDRLHVDRNQVTGFFSDGSSDTGDLMIAADGMRSTVRHHLLPRVTPDYAGYIAWRAMVPEHQVSPAAQTLLFDRYAFCLPPAELAVSYPVPGPDGDTRPGHRSYNIVWYRSATLSELAGLCTDAAGRQHELAIPPPLIRAEIVADIKQSARELLPAPIAGIIAQSIRPFFQPIFDLVSPRLVFGRVVLLGDAAFVARPHVGAGVTKAALDATTLADAVAAETDLEAGLERYDDERRRFGNWMVARGRELGAWIGAAGDTQGRSAAPESHQRLQTVIHQYITSVLDMRRQAIHRKPCPREFPTDRI